jgi:hypothetical protein
MYWGSNTADLERGLRLVLAFAAFGALALLAAGGWIAWFLITHLARAS